MKKTVNKKTVVKNYKAIAEHNQKRIEELHKELNEKSEAENDRKIKEIIFYIESSLERVFKKPALLSQLDLIDKAAQVIGAEQVSLLLQQTPEQVMQRYKDLVAKREAATATFRDNLEINFLEYFKATPKL